MRCEGSQNPFEFRKSCTKAMYLIGHREYPYTQKPEDEAKANWEIAKNRNGATMNIPMQWDGKTTTFYEETKTYINFKKNNDF